MRRIGVQDMFSHLTDFGYQRTRKQALGFYITYALALLVLGGIAGFWAGLVQQYLMHSTVDYQQISYVGIAIAALGSAIVAYAVIARKNLQATYLWVVLFAGLTGGLLGAFVGLIFAAVVSTKAPAARVDVTQMSRVLR
jgi:uncharacterized membrane protein YfcA